MRKSKNKYDKRRALMCKLVRKSKSSKGYFRYDVSIGERDGTITRCITAFTMEATYGEN